MKLISDNLANGEVIPDRHAFAVPDAESHVKFSENVSPHLKWTGVPDGTKSIAVQIVDVDVPSRPDDVNQPDREIPSDLPRVDFYHLSLANIPPTVAEFAEGELCRGVTPSGKAPGGGPTELLEGINDYTGWFSGDPDMEGRYHGYDGPAPPWNDSIVHRYRFSVYALDVAELDLEHGFSGADLLSAMEGHILAEASLMGTYALNPRLRQD